MYKLTYTTGGVKVVVTNEDAKHLREIIDTLKTEDKWELRNRGGVILDTNIEKQLNLKFLKSRG